MDWRVRARRRGGAGYWWILAGGSRVQVSMAPTPEFMRALHAQRRAARTHFACGHEIAAENTYTNPAGSATCRECKRASQRIAKARARAEHDLARSVLVEPDATIPARRRAKPHGGLFGLPVSFWANFSERGGCWEWTRARWNGYGKTDVTGRTRRVYQVTWEAIIGPVPDGLELDHLCRNRACANPDHLEPVTHAENMGRAANLEREPAATAGAWGNPLCPAGHVKDRRNSQGWMVCSECMKTAKARHRARRKAG